MLLICLPLKDHIKQYIYYFFLTMHLLLLKLGWLGGGGLHLGSPITFLGLEVVVLVLSLVSGLGLTLISICLI